MLFRGDFPSQNLLEDSGAECCDANSFHCIRPAWRLTTQTARIGEKPMRCSRRCDRRKSQQCSQNSSTGGPEEAPGQPAAAAEMSRSHLGSGQFTATMVPLGAKPAAVMRVAIRLPQRVVSIRSHEFLRYYTRQESAAHTLRQILSLSNPPFRI